MRIGMIKQTSQTLHASTNDRRLFTLLLIPSWLSGFFCITFSLAIITTVVISSHFSSTVEQQVNFLLTLNADSDLSYYGGSNGFTLSNILAIATTAVFWAIVGLTSYLTVASIISAVQKARQFKHELGYVNSRPGKLMQTALIHFLLRATIFVLWFFYLKFFFGVILPHCLLWVFTAYSFTFSSVCSILLAFIVATSAAHVHVVLLRLLALRPRIFHGESYL